MGKAAKKERLIASQLGVDGFRYDKGDIRVTTPERRSERRCEVIFSKTLYRMWCDGKISQAAYEKARDICDTLEAIEGSQIKSMLDTDVIASAAGKSANKMPVGVTDIAMDRAKKVRLWKAEAGEMWPAVAGVCAFGLTVDQAAREVRRRKGFVSASIKCFLEI
ncbi:hypothetical protein [Terasakiella pusilla]|uniref:hypothetical protein n=1 Tax=Terasakiella pusilla TaxID=64973 RepID=UPI003AA85A2D